MTIELSSEVFAAMESYVIQSVFLVSVMTRTEGVINATDANREITYEGSVYSPNSSLIAITPPQHQGSTERDKFAIQFADNSGGIRARFVTDGVRGIELTVKYAFLNDDNSVIGVIDIYAGRSAGLNWSKDGDGYKCTIDFTGQLAQLDAAYPLSTTEVSQRRLDPNDTSMNKAHEPTNDDGLKWGRK